MVMVWWHTDQINDQFVWMSFQLSALQTIEWFYLHKCFTIWLATQVSCVCAHLLSWVHIEFTAKKKKKKRRRILFQHFILKLVRFYLSNDFFFSNGITSFLTGVGQQKVCWCLLEEFENPHCSSSLLKHPRETQIWNNQVNEKASYLFLPCIMLKLLSVGTFSSLFLLPLSLVSRVK